jgi:Rrf2 family protein
MADIARYGADGPVPLSDVAERQGISRLYLSQLAMLLRHSVLLKSVWGNKGGYVLARPAGTVTLLEIMEAVDGPVSIIDCVAVPGACERASYCECIGVWRDINDAITRTLDKYSLPDLIERGEPQGRAGLVCFSVRGG